MRILLTTDTIGGVWTFTRELCMELLRRGHEVALASFGRLPSEEQRAWADLQERTFPQCFRYVSSDAPLEWMEENEASYAGGASVLLQLTKQVQPDIVHSNQLCYGALPLSIPIVVTAHSDVLSWAAACRPEGLEDTPWLRRYLDIVQRGLESATTVVAPTRWMAEALQYFYEDLPQVHVIFNGRTIPPPPMNGERALQAVTAGRLWDEAKNATMLREVHSPMPILIAGEQGEQNIAANGQIGSARLLGALPELALLNLFRQSSIYLATSIYEPFGLAPLEAALCGCAVLVNDIASLREVWGEAALYFRDASSLSALLLRLSNDRSMIAKAQAVSRARAHELTTQRMADQYETLYSRLLTDERLMRDAPLADLHQERVVHVA
jgi:glycosyltransferase involved in cell wall biosynthesis